jgi:hypothetical protein
MKHCVFCAYIIVGLTENGSSKSIIDIRRLSDEI